MAYLIHEITNCSKETCGLQLVSAINNILEKDNNNVQWFLIVHRQESFLIVQIQEVGLYRTF